MAWTSPKTWSAVLVTVADLNTHIRDNLNLLKTSINNDGTLMAPMLLKSGNGSSAAAVATNVDTVALGLTAADQLLVHITARVLVNTSNRLDLYSVTDGQVVASVSLGGAINAGVTLVAQVLIMPDQAALTTYNAMVNGATTGGPTDNASAVTGLTAWTSPWTMALRHAGQSAGGSIVWRWAVYKMNGQ